MSHKIKNYLAIILTFFAITVPALIPVTTFAAACTQIPNEITNGLNAATSSPGGTCGTSDITSGLKTTAVTVVNILSIVVGIVAVIMIIYGGFRYITSGGESGNVQSAKNTLLFAIVGLVIVALAQVIVRWVIGTSANIAAGFIHLFGI